MMKLASTDSFLPIYLEKYAARLGVRRDGFRSMFSLLEAARPQGDFRIVETGSMRVLDNWAGDGQSTILFDQFVTFHGGEVLTVDMSPECGDLIARTCSEQVRFTCDDSVRYLHKLRTTGDQRIDLLYLDSFDLDFNQPTPSAFHHIKELLAIWPALAPGAVIVVDDNPPGMIGKGYLVENFFDHLGIPRVFDGYQKLWQL